MYTGSDGFLRAVERYGVGLWQAQGYGADEWVAEDGYCPNCGSRTTDAQRNDRQRKRGAKSNKPDRVRLFSIEASRATRQKGEPCGRWWCHKCDESGDGIDFLRRRFGLSYVDAYTAIHGKPPPDRPGWKSAQPKPQGGAGVRPAPARSTAKPVAENQPKRMPAKPATQSAPNVLPIVSPAPKPRTEPSLWHVQKNPEPCFEWQAQARVLTCKLDFLNRDVLDGSYVRSRKALEDAREWIEQGRGIPLETASECGLYWNPVNLYFPASLWGLKRETVGKDGRKKEAKLFVPKGIVIAMTRYRYAPHCESGSIVGLLVRRAEPDEETGDKLRWVPCRDDDSPLPRTRTFILGEAGQPAIVTESATDAALLHYLTEGQVATVSTCGAGYPLDEDAAEILQGAPKLWAMPDADEEGAKAFAKWRARFPAMQAIEMPRDARGVPVAKDATELERLSRQHAELPTVSQILFEQGVLNG